MWCFLSSLMLHFLALVSCPTWWRHICNLFAVAMLCLLGSDGLWAYVQIVVSYIFGSPFIFCSWVFLHVLLCFLLLWPSSRLYSKREHYAWLWVHAPSLSDRNMRLGDVLLPPEIKQRCLYLRGARIVYFTQSSFNVVVCCFEFTLWVGFAT